MNRMKAFILAGGAGKRLSLLTARRAKPAVPFGGRYRIIDFTLTNCVKSGIDEVFVLTQYISRSLTRHLGIGKPWDLDRSKGGLRILHPHLGFQAADWYQGTADAMYQNIPILREIDCEYVLILSGDHVYNMDYHDFLDFHIERGFPATLAVTPVPRSMTRHFGIATIGKDDRIERFEEKPESSPSDLGSMGVYIFDREFLIETLESIKTLHENLDFGHHIMPRLVRAGSAAAYRFEGYWLDIGTLKGYYRASKGLLARRPRLVLGEGGTTVMTVPDDNPPMMIMRGAGISRSIVCSGCRIEGRVESSIISPGVRVEKGAVVEDSIIFHDCTVGRGARIRSSVLDKEVRVGRDSVIGEGDRRTPNETQPEYLDFGLTLIGKGTRVMSGSLIGTNCLVAGSVGTGRLREKRIPDGGTRLTGEGWS